MLRMIFLRT